MSDFTGFLVCYLACLKVPKTIEKPFVSIFLGFEGFFSYIDPSIKEAIHGAFFVAATSVFYSRKVKCMSIMRVI